MKHIARTVFVVVLCVVISSCFTKYQGDKAEVVEIVKNNPVGVHYSELWGKNGEKWTSKSRLPDVSYAGYQFGEKAIPTVPVKVNVKDFGAKGDGIQDDTRALQEAIKACENGAVYLPEGRYKLSGVIKIDKSNIVLRGAGPKKTILYYPKGTGELNGTVSDRTPREFFIVIDKGDPSYYPKIYGKKLGKMSAKALRGSYEIKVDSPEKYKTGDIIVLKEDTSANLRDGKYEYKNKNLMLQLAAGEQIPGASLGLVVAHIAKVKKVDGNIVTINRPLRYDMQADIMKFKPTLTEVGLEDFGIEFGNQPYPSHFGGPGNNAISMQHCAHSWVRNLRIHNCDNGISCGGVLSTVSDITFTADRLTCTEYQKKKIPGLIIKPDVKGFGFRPPDDKENPGGKVQLLDCTGHHGIWAVNFDNLVTRINIKTVFVHSITVNKSIGCVISAVKGVDCCLDHHRRAPSENVWTDIDAGKGTHLWLSTGRGQEGIKIGARETFWNIRTELPQQFHTKKRKGKRNGKKIEYDIFSNELLNIVGIKSDEPAVKGPVRWWDPIKPEELCPKDLHMAQRLKRLKDDCIDFAPPVAVANAELTGPLTISFSSEGSNDADGPIHGYLWSFGDGYTSRMKNPVHIYSLPGSYLVQLLVFDKAGSIGKAQLKINLSDK